MNYNAREVLTAARDELVATEGKNLISGSLVGENHDGTICFCALGYIAKAAGFPIIATTDDYPCFSVDGHDQEEGAVYDALNEHPATKALAHAISPIGEDLHLQGPVYDVYCYNDAKVKQGDYRAVIEAFDTAIELLKD